MPFNIKSCARPNNSCASAKPCLAFLIFAPDCLYKPETLHYISNQPSHNVPVRYPWLSFASVISLYKPDTLQYISNQPSHKMSPCGPIGCPCLSFAWTRAPAQCEPIVVGCEQPGKFAQHIQHNPALKYIHHSQGTTWEKEGQYQRTKNKLSSVKFVSPIS